MSDVQTAQEAHTFTERLESNRKFDDKFAGLFDQLVTNNFITKDVVVDGVKFTLKTLSSQDYLESDTIYMATMSGLPMDVIGRARMISNLAYSITAINDVPVVDFEFSRRNDRQKLYENLYKLPPWMIDQLNVVFLEIMKIKNTEAQDLNMPGRATEQIENF